MPSVPLRSLRLLPAMLLAGLVTSACQTVSDRPIDPPPKPGVALEAPPAAVVPGPDAGTAKPKPAVRKPVAKPRAPAATAAAGSATDPASPPNSGDRSRRSR